MTYTSGSPTTPASPQTKLADRKWRWLNSWWIFAPIIGCGFFGFLGFLVAAIRTGKRHYWVATGAYAFMGALSLTLVTIAGEDKSGPMYVLGNIAVFPFLIAAIGPIIHAAIKNQDYLTTIAHKGAWYATPPAPDAYATQPTSFIGVSSSDYFAPGPPNATGFGPQMSASSPQTYRAAPAPQTSGAAPVPPPMQAPAAGPQQSTPAGSPAPSSPTARVDVNRATAGDLASGLNIDQALASHVIAVRDARGGYQNIDDLAAAASLQPHQLVRFRGQVTFGATQGQQNPPSGPTGRILDY